MNPSDIEAKRAEAERDRDRWEVEIQLAVHRGEPTGDLWQRMIWADHRARMWTNAGRDYADFEVRS
jgi:hypothetical protein